MENGHGRPYLKFLLGQLLTCLPQFCCFCHQKTNTAVDLCQFCLWHLPPIIISSGQESPSSTCLRCGFIWPDAVLHTECAHCVNYQTGYGQVICPYRYDFPIDGLLHRLKYQNHLPSGRLLGCLLAKEVCNQLSVHEYPDLLLPVPLNSHRYRGRGFNQAAEIAHWCGHTLGVDVCAHGAYRRFDTDSLVGLSRAERGLRIRGAFGVSEALQGRSVAIVDDVLTTGATSGELATELLDSGVKDVQLWVVARTPATGRAGGS